MRRSVRLGRDALVAGALALAAFTAARQLLAARPLIDGVDLYYYLCVARDLADGATTSAMRHFYFPGVYRFWEGGVRGGRPLAAGGSVCLRRAAGGECAGDGGGGLARLR